MTRSEADAETEVQSLLGPITILDLREQVEIMQALLMQDQRVVDFFLLQFRLVQQPQQRFMPLLEIILQAPHLLIPAPASLSTASANP
jgi:hypothetical protein